MKRREFVKSAARFGVSAALGAGLVWGFRSKKISTEAKSACPVNPSCVGCGQYSKCTKEIKQDKTKAAGAAE